MITGYFTKFSVPQVAAGQRIRATLGYYAKNPGAIYWKTFLIAGGIDIKKEVSATREWGEGRGERTYDIGVMPPRRVSITFALFAHDNAGYDWSWTDWTRWVEDLPSSGGAQFLDYRIVTLDPGTPAPTPISGDLKVLDHQILGESQGGSITFNPPPLDYQGHYRKGTVVTLKAVVNPGFRFDKWRGEVDDELSTSLTNTVTMSENRLVKAEFGTAEVQRSYPLAIDITPVGAGYITTEPPPDNIDNRFIHDTVGKFPAGIRVLVTAHPEPGHEFLKWSDEIQGGQSYSNPEFVAGVMDEHRGVKAHFAESGAPVTPTPTPTPAPTPMPTPPPEDGFLGLKKEWLVPGLVIAAVLLFLPGKKGK